MKTDIPGEGDHVTTEAEIGVTDLQTKDCLGLSEAGGGKEERRILEASEVTPTEP